MLSVSVSVCLFFLWWASLSEMVILSADDLVCILVCLLFRCSVLHRVLLVVGWCHVLYSRGFLCVISHYFILPKVSSLVVLDLGVSAPTLKVQGFISGQEQIFHKWFVMELRESKTNIQKWETKDEPQTNGSYRIRQIIIKNGIYIYTYTPMSKVKTVQQK